MRWDLTRNDPFRKVFFLVMRHLRNRNHQPSWFQRRNNFLIRVDLRSSLCSRNSDDDVETRLGVWCQQCQSDQWRLLASYWSWYPEPRSFLKKIIFRTISILSFRRKNALEALPLPATQDALEVLLLNWSFPGLPSGHSFQKWAPQGCFQCASLGFPHSSFVSWVVMYFLHGRSPFCSSECAIARVDRIMSVASIAGRKFIAMLPPCSVAGLPRRKIREYIWGRVLKRPRNAECEFNSK
jgi:hypothetical protein